MTLDEILVMACKLGFDQKERHSAANVWREARVYARNNSHPDPDLRAYEVAREYLCQEIDKWQRRGYKRRGPMKKAFLTIVALILIAAPTAFAWDRAECEAVDWKHPDCAWGRPPEPAKTSHHHSSDAGSYTKSIWKVDSIEVVQPGIICSFAHKQLVTPARVHPGTPTIVDFPDIKVRKCYYKQPWRTA